MQHTSPHEYIWSKEFAQLETETGRTRKDPGHKIFT
jgi:hypothetical protein